ncbi:MAG: hypothetical protein P0Y53_03470 [Candidatus Pseudobacter hemicellulosilyticus]|uniref:Uncharacterized protein n=1 Tax=Candidatus Pseudobacter hemicellulosilyticus TaxID=3121375 RepID=A0AAJ5WSK3_9BACT|nr:MAG: hypothetical protein P0Y53_03470 [Pseudobacter sp.]
MEVKILAAAPPSALQKWFWWLLTGNILFIAGTTAWLYPFSAADILSFETAGKLLKAEPILLDWLTAGKLPLALRAIYLDYAFILLYVSFLSVAALFLSRLTGHEILIRFGRGMSWMLIVAGACDVIENMFMLRSLNHGLTAFNVALTYDMAAAKFTVVILALLFGLVCLIYWLSSRFSR